MANLLDYLHWRGDLDFLRSPFNELDAGILAALSYADLGGAGMGITLREAASRVFERAELESGEARKKPRLGRTISLEFDLSLASLLSLAAETSRFGSIRVSRFVEDLDLAVGRQFAALTFSLPKGSLRSVVAFRGTDDTVLGWKEDFSMLYREEVPAHASARHYLHRVMGELGGRFCVCGHSKGGNLAVYAAAHLGPWQQRRVERVYCLDGPGFNYPLVDPRPFERIARKVVNLVPSESMVGMLLETVGERRVVASTARYALQHNLMTWEVERTRFKPAELSDVARLIDMTVKGWLTEISVEERAAFMEAFFDLLDAPGDATVSITPLENMRIIRRLLHKYARLDKETRRLMGNVFRALTAQARQHVKDVIKARLPESILPVGILPDILRPDAAHPESGSGPNA